ncbi:TauD/TfdA family dioxygenase [Lentzea sp. NPDC004789]
MTPKIVASSYVAENRLVLRSSEKQAMLDLVKSVSADPAMDPELFCVQASRAARVLPTRIHDALLSFDRRGSATGTFLIEGMPVGPIPATPPDNTLHLGEATLLSKAQAIVNEAAGHMLAYEAEGFGRLFQDMVPARSAAHTQTSLGSSVELELHTEQAFSVLRPDFISLACLRGDPNAQTYTLTARQVAEAVTTAELETLRQKCWMTGVDLSFRRGGQAFDKGEIRGPLSILEGAEDDPFIVFDQDLMTSNQSAATAAFDTVIDTYRRHRHCHVLKPGDLLLIDNHRVVHGRSPFRPLFDGSDRFVVRSFVVRDLSKSRFARPCDSRTIAARFS